MRQLIPPTLNRLLLLILCAFLLLSLPLAVLGQGEQNLLTNPGFENPYRVVPGEPDREVATGWTPWHVERTSGMRDFENAQPEYAQAAPNSARIRSDNNAQMYFNTWFTHDGGVYQRVTGITPGTELRFSVYAYVWSSNESDPNISSSPGGILVQVGIDPTGGTDGSSNNIVWSVPVEQYDAYRQYSVIATAVSNAVTVFVRSRIEFPQANNYIYLDDAVLAATIADEPATAIATTTATNTSVPPTMTNTPIPPTLTSIPLDPTPTREDGISDPQPTATWTAIPLPTRTPPAIGGPIDATFPSSIVHTVQRGDTVSRLAVLYGSTTQAIIEVNNLNDNGLIFVGQGLIVPVRVPSPATSTPSPTPLVPVPTATPAPGTGGPIVNPSVYIVQRGDTLSRIAVRFSTTVSMLAQMNGIVNPNLIQVGQQLVIPGTGDPAPAPTPPPPPPVVTNYVVAPGDTLFRISVRFGVPMQQLVTINNIGNPNLIYVGQVLRIPG